MAHFQRERPRVRGTLTMRIYTARVRDDQVLEAVVGVARPRDEVVHVRRLAGAAREALRAVEAPSLLELDDRPAHALERHALGAEEEALELVARRGGSASRP